MTPRALSFTVPLLAFSAACASPSFFYLPTDPPPRPLTARPPETVEIFFGGRPKRDYVEVGLLQAEQGGLEASFRHGRLAVLRKLRAQAAGIGCDAVLVLAQADRVEGCYGVTASASSNPSTKRGVRASCIVYRDPVPAGPAGDARTAEGAR